MAVYEYLAVLISIVLGFALAHILSYFGFIIRRERTIEFYWPALLWLLIIFVIVLLSWWSNFSLVHHRIFTFAAFAVSVAVPSLIYIMCVVLFPEHHSMREAYWAHNRPFFAIFIVALLLTFLQTFLIDGTIKVNLDTGMKLGLAALLALAWAAQKELAHKAIVTVCALLIALYVGILFASLGG